MLGKKDDKNSKDFQGKNPVFFIKHIAQLKGKSARESMVYPSHLALPPCPVLHTLSSSLKMTGDEPGKRTPSKSCIPMT